MKKIFMYTMLTLGAGLSSCTTKDLNWESPNKGPVAVEVTIPEEGEPTDGATAPFPETPEGYRLRCVVQVAGGNRYEAVESDAVNNKFYFDDADIPAGSTLYVWADYILADAAADADGHYPDLYYDTQSLPEVTFADGVMTDGSLFNNPACDAFYATATAGSAIQLKRPFARVTYTSPEAISVGGEIEVFYSVFNRFDIATGTASGEGEIRYTGEVADRTNRVWFSNYLFANAVEGKAVQSDIFISGADILKRFDTSAMSLAANKPVTAALNWTSGKISVSVDVGFDDPDAPEVGFYYFSDGTWSRVLVDDRMPVGVIFALASDGAENDSPENYPKKDFTEIHGWVVSLKDYTEGGRTRTPRFVSNADGQAGSLTTAEGVGTGTSDIKGYANCLAWPENELAEGDNYTALDGLAAHADEQGALPDEDDVVTSGWYIGSLGQMMVLREKYTEEGSAVKAALQALVESGQAELLREGTGGSNYYWTSTSGSSSDIPVGVYRMSTSTQVTGTPYILRNGTDGNTFRPILTF